MQDYRVETPEQVELGYTAAGLGTRFMALALDTLIQGVLLTVLIISLVALDFNTGWTAEWYVAIIMIVSVVILGLYFMIFELLMKGRTPGKAALRLRVVRKDGRAADTAGIIIRNLIRLIDFLPALYGIGVVSMFVSKDCRRIGDFAAGTLVVREEKAPSLESIMSRSANAATPEGQGGGMYGNAGSASVLTNDEYALIRDFLSRCGRLTPNARYALAYDLALPLFERLETPAPGRHSPEEFLERLMREEEANHR